LPERVPKANTAFWPVPDNVVKITEIVVTETILMQLQSKQLLHLSKQADSLLHDVLQLS